MKRADFKVHVVTWAERAPELQFVRRRVFIEEQSVPEADEWDAADATSIHALALNSDGEPIGTARLLADGHIGRMAVMREWRGTGVGAALLQKMIAVGRARGQSEFIVSAQTHALAFYARFGFVAFGETYLDVEIPHRTMALRV